MVELLAANTAVGVASSLITFADVAWRVAKRIKEYNERTTDAPKVTAHISAQLPLIIEKIQALRTDSEDGSLITPGSSLAIALIHCDKDITRLDSLTAKLLPDETDSKFKRARRALNSIRYEKEISSIWETLQSYVTTLTFHVTEIKTAIQNSEDSSSQIAFMAPFERDEDFVGRSATLAEVGENLNNQPRVALAGIGGVGKSQVAIEYCFQYRDEHPDRHIFWIHASNYPRLQQGYAEIARNNKIPGWNDPKVNIIHLVHEWLTHSERKWLLVLDNADDIKMFRGPIEESPGHELSKPLIAFIPRCSNGSILITTRDKRAGEVLSLGKSSILLQAMTPDEALAVLKAKLPLDLCSHTDATALISELEFLPLAITQAAAYIRHNSITIAAYLTLLSSEDAEIKALIDQELDDPRRDSRSQNAIVRTWKLSFDQIKGEDTYASDMLSLMAVLDRHSIPTFLLRNDHRGIVRFTTALGTLKAFSFISSQKNAVNFEMHRLVQLSMQKWLELQGTLSMWQQNAIEAVEKKLPLGNFANWKTCEILIPHVNVVLRYLSDRPNSAILRANVLSRMGHYESEIGRYQSAVSKQMDALQIRRQTLGEDHQDTLLSMNILALTYWRQGQYKNAAALQKQLLDFSMRGQGQYTILAMVNLASTYWRQGQYDSAVSLLELLLEPCKEELGEEHPATMKIMSNLGTNYFNQHQYGKAVVLQEQAVELLQRVLGEEHPDTLRSMNNLTATYTGLGEHDKATTLQERVVELCMQVLGKEHPDTLKSVSLLSWIYRKQDQYNNAAALSKQVIEVQNRILGEEHPDTVDNLRNLILIYWRQGLYDKTAAP